MWELCYVYNNLPRYIIVKASTQIDAWTLGLLRLAEEYGDEISKVFVESVDKLED